MAQPLVDCPEHGVVPAAPGTISFGDGVQFISIGSRTHCGVCRRVSPIVDGSYQLHGDHIHADLWLTPDQWVRVQRTLERVVAERPSDPLAEIAKANHEIANQMAQAVEAMKARTPRTSTKTLAIKLAEAVLGLVLAATAGVAGNLISDEIQQRGGQQQEPQQPQQLERLNREVLRLLGDTRRQGRLPGRGKPAERGRQEPPTPQ